VVNDCRVVSRFDVRRDADMGIGIHAGRVVYEGGRDALDAQALALIYPGLEGMSQAEAESEGISPPVAKLMS